MLVELRMSKMGLEVLIQTPKQGPCELEWGKVSQSEPEGAEKSESDSDIVSQR